MARPKEDFREKKTETITIRVSQSRKKLISDLAWLKRMTVSELLTSLAISEMYRFEKSGVSNLPMKDMVEKRFSDTNEK